MARIKVLKTNFTAGEIGGDLMGRGDLRAYANGAARLKNVFVLPTGGVTRRPGLRHIASVAGDGRLIAFEFNTEQTYLLMVTHQAIAIYDEAETPIASLSSPWSSVDIPRLSWTQSADTLLLLHPDHPPKRLVRTAATSFELRDFEYPEESERIQQPHRKYAESEVTLQASATSGSITLTASADVFEAGHVGTRFRIVNKEIEITAVDSPTQASAAVKESLSTTSATKDWSEQAFNAVRGYPICCVFHQDRLVLGGGRDAPNRLWLSKSSDLFNFDLGTGEDDEAIEFAILSDQVNAIQAVFSGRHLQLLTSGAEWMITGEPLTPTNLELKRQTRVGSPTDRFVPPRDVDGGTLFVSRDGRTLREFLFTDTDQAYQATDLSALVAHMIDHPTDLDYDPRRRLIFVVMGDGTVAALTQYRQEEVTAWSTMETPGNFRSVAVRGGEVYFLVERNGTYRIERLDKAVHTDGAFLMESETPRAQWGAASGDASLAPIDGVSGTILADEHVHPASPITAGTLTLDQPAARVEVGRPYLHEVAPLPIFNQSSGGGGPRRGRRRGLSGLSSACAIAARYLLIPVAGPSPWPSPMKTGLAVRSPKRPQPSTKPCGR